MNINAINLVNSVRFASRNTSTDASRRENKLFSNSIRRITGSPVYDTGLADADELEFRTGIEDFESGTRIRTFENNCDNWEKELCAPPETTKAKPAKITTEAQAKNIERLIEDLRVAKMANPGEARNISAQIGKLTNMLKSYKWRSIFVKR